MKKHLSGILVNGQIRELSELFAWDREIEEIARPIEGREYASSSKYARTMERNAEEFIEGCDMYSSDPADFYEGPEKPAPVDQVSLAVQSIFACLHVEERVENGERKRYLHSEGLRKMWETFEFERTEAFRAKKAEWKEWKENPEVRAHWAMAFKRFNSQDSLLGRVEFEVPRGIVKNSRLAEEAPIGTNGKPTRPNRLLVSRGEGAYAGEAGKVLDTVDKDGFILQATDGGDWVERAVEGWRRFTTLMENGTELWASHPQVQDGIVRKGGKKIRWLKGPLHPASKKCRAKGLAPMPFVLGYLTNRAEVAKAANTSWWTPEELLKALQGQKASLPSHWAGLVPKAVRAFQLSLIEAPETHQEALEVIGDYQPLGLKYEGIQGYPELLEKVQTEMIGCWSKTAAEIRSTIFKVKAEIEVAAQSDEITTKGALQVAKAWRRLDTKRLGLGVRLSNTEWTAKTKEFKGETFSITISRARDTGFEERVWKAIETFGGPHLRVYPMSRFYRHRITCRLSYKVKQTLVAILERPETVSPLQRLNALSTLWKMGKRVAFELEGVIK